MFVIFFAIFIFVLTIRENIWLAAIVFGLLLIGLIAFIIVKSRIKSSKPAKYRKVFLLLFIAFFLAVGSWFWNNNSLAPATPSVGGSFM
jgi:hypothetical protein